MENRLMTFSCRNVGPGGTDVDVYVTDEGLKAIWSNENCPYTKELGDLPYEAKDGHNVDTFTWERTATIINTLLKALPKGLVAKALSDVLTHDTKTSLKEKKVKSKCCKYFNIKEFFDTKLAWSRDTYGDLSSKTIIDHLHKEIIEASYDPKDILEWVDIILLAIDGAGRFANADGATFVEALKKKFEINRKRTWSIPVDGSPPEHTG